MIAILAMGYPLGRHLPLGFAIVVAAVAALAIALRLLWTWRSQYRTDDGTSSWPAAPKAALSHSRERPLPLPSDPQPSPPDSSYSIDDDERLARRSREALVPLGLVAVPPIVFLLGLAVDVYLQDLYRGRQWLINGVGMATGYGALASLLCGPVSLIATIFSFRKMTPGHQVLSLVFLALALGPLLYIALYLFGLQNLS